VVDKVPGNVQGAISAVEMSESGWRVYNTCLGINGNWEKDQQPWFAAASQAHKFLKEAMEAEAQFQAPILAQGIYLWAAGDNPETSFMSLAGVVQYAWQAVARCWASAVNASMTAPDEDVGLPDIEKTAVAWFQSRVAKANGKQVQPKAERVPPEVQGGKTTEVIPVDVPDYVQRFQEKRLETLPVRAGSAVAGFRDVIQIKIDEYMAKAIALEKFKAIITDDVNEALLEIFKEIMQK
jgi:hypothetical protein